MSSLLGVKIDEGPASVLSLGAVEEEFFLGL
jgi:hypothetical protein